MKRTSIVTTTINNPNFIKKYIDNFKKHYVKREDFVFIIVGDNKTPHKLFNKKVKKLSSDYDIEYWSPTIQKIWIKSHFGNKSLKGIIPENNPRRRNFGYLRALELDSDYTITIDDDNIPIKGDWLNDHLESFSDKQAYPIVRSNNRIVNPCRILRCNQPIVYFRGYPISEIFSDSFTILKDMKNSNPVKLNLGLWFNKPDVDAYTNIIYPDLESESNYYFKVALQQNNFMPINTQNTSFTKEISPIFWNLYMRKVHNLQLNRFDDIWGGLFTLKLILRNNCTATFGSPFANHDRNIHSFNKDLRTEFVGITVNSRIWNYVMCMEIGSRNYIDGYLEIADWFDKAKLFSDNKLNKFIKDMSNAMRTWIDLVDVIHST